MNQDFNVISKLQDFFMRQFTAKKKRHIKPYSKNYEMTDKKNMKLVAVGKVEGGITTLTFTEVLPLSHAEYLDIVRKKVKRSTLVKLMKETDITLEEMAEIMDMNKAIITSVDNKKLDQNQSEKAVLIERLYKRGEEVFESRQLFKQWMNSKVKSLENKKPKEYLDTVYGINLITDEIERLAYGVYS